MAKEKELTVKLSDFKLNDGNPRLIKDERFGKLVDSVKGFLKMLALRPIVFNPADKVIIGGNMRFRALLYLGYKECPEKWIQPATDFTDDEIRQFIIVDNVQFGEWDWDMVSSDWDEVELDKMGFEARKMAGAGDPLDKPEVEFSEFLDEEHNYVVLYFDNRIDWIQAQTHFNLKTVSAKRQNGKEWSKGIGRVVNGSKYLNGLKTD